MNVTRIRPARKRIAPWQIRIELLDVKPAVWRRLLVPESITLPRLHRVFQVALGAALGRESRTFDYLYDFGDGWHHAVVVEDRFMQPRADFVVQCLAGENACPPEDVGGPPGYAGFLAAIADPRHEEHRQYLDWWGGSFDSARFELGAVNRALKGGRS